MPEPRLFDRLLRYVQCQGPECTAVYRRSHIPVECWECGSTPLTVAPWDPTREAYKVPVEAIMASMVEWLETTDAYHDENGRLYFDFMDALVHLATHCPQMHYFWEEETTNA